ncbi:MAG: hypothetical protein JXA93_00020 [Anaerolineae bacterium]|nr:hypothetical protein [Anaerolineae bacterium]
MGASKSSRYQKGSSHTPGPTVIAGVFVALLILFLWLHFIVAQENEMIGREIQARTEELARIERENLALRQQLAAVFAEQEMAGRAYTLGFRAQPPLYLLLSHPLVPAAGGSRSEALLLPTSYGYMPQAGSTANPAAGAQGNHSTTTTTGRP